MWSIGPLSKATHCKVETIRYYEKIGLVPAPARSDGGHRLYQATHRDRLLFIRRARELGFSLDEVREFISLSENESRSCGEALKAVELHLESVRAKQARLQQIEAALLTMARDCKSCCAGSTAPDCTIIEALAGNDELTPARD